MANSSKKIGVGIVGVGGIVQTTHLPVLKSIENVEVVAVCDSNEQKATWVANKFKVPTAHFRYEKLLKMDEIDAVVLCTPNNLHYPMTKRAIEAGKSVFIEKPVTKNLQELEKLIKISEGSDKVVMVGMNHRFREDSAILKDVIDSGELGEIFYSKSGWMIRRPILDRNRWYFRSKVSGGGVIIDLGLQLIDLTLWLLGNPEPKAVFATAYSKAAKLEVEDSAALQIICADDETISIEVSWSLMTEKEVHYTNIFGTNGGALLNPLRINKELAGNLVNVTPAAAIDNRNLIKNSYKAELKHFIECLEGSAENRSTLADSLHAMRIVDAAYKSIDKGILVKL